MSEGTTSPDLAVAARLRKLRQERALSLDSLASLCGVSRSMLSKIERGESMPTVGAAVRIAAALSVPLAHLLGVDEGMRVVLRPVGHQEVLADPRSGTTRYQLLPGGRDAGAPSAERLVAPPGAGPLALPPVEPGRHLAVTVSAGRLSIRCGDGEWLLGEGDSIDIRGPAAVLLLPVAGELGVAYLFAYGAEEGQ